ncbi:MAG: tetratricopeptide repeat protein [Cryobacterium sp.]|nr:tetratricopeptide repeat protein [Cryobacterium sp.]
MTDLPPTQLRGAVDLSSLLRDKPGAPAAGAGPANPDGPPSGEAVVESLVFAATDANFGEVLELSRTVTVIVELYAGSPSATLERVVRGFAGKLVLATVDARLNAQVAQAFRVTAAPTVAAVIGGRPVALYEGELPEAESRSVLEQVLTIAAQNGVTGSAAVAAPADPADPPVEEPLPPHHQAAFDAIDRGDFEAAISEYRTAIAQDPRDVLAVAGLAQVSLLARLDGKTAEDIRASAASNPDDLESQLAVADLDVSGGHLDDAFGRLLDLFAGLDSKSKDAVRTRLLSYFEIAGADDPRVANARRRLTSLLY